MMTMMTMMRRRVAVKGVQTGRRPRTKRTSWVGARPQHALRASLTTMTTTTTLLVPLLPLRTLHATLYDTRTAIMCSSSLRCLTACASARRRTSAAAAQQQHPPHPTSHPSLPPSPAAHTAGTESSLKRSASLSYCLLDCTGGGRIGTIRRSSL